MFKLVAKAEPIKIGQDSRSPPIRQDRHVSDQIDKVLIGLTTDTNEQKQPGYSDDRDWVHHFVMKNNVRIRHVRNTTNFVFENDDLCNNP